MRPPAIVHTTAVPGLGPEHSLTPRKNKSKTKEIDILRGAGPTAVHRDYKFPVFPLPFAARLAAAR